ncbi:MAG: hypothetical protein ACOY41_03200 [Pseudomonadota bacterium]
MKRVRGLCLAVARLGRLSASVAGVLLALQAFAGEARAGRLQELSNDEMAEVVGFKGVGLLLELNMNTDANGAPLASLSNCAGTNNPCKLGFLIANRSGGGGEWLMLKDYFGRLFIDGLNVDGSFNPATDSAYRDANRFKDDAGTCLLAACDPRNLPALQLAFTGSPSAFENDVTMGLEVGRMSIEYGATGFNNDANGSFLGLRVRDTGGGTTSIDIDGKVRVYGF